MVPDGLVHAKQGGQQLEIHCSHQLNLLPRGTPGDSDSEMIMNASSGFDPWAASYPPITCGYVVYSTPVECCRLTELVDILCFALGSSAYVGCRSQCAHEGNKVTLGRTASNDKDVFHVLLVVTSCNHQPPWLSSRHKLSLLNVRSHLFASGFNTLCNH